MKARGQNKELRRLIGLLEQAGCDVRDGGSHPKVFFGGRFVTTLASTPSDWRAHRNALARIRRAGARI